MSSRYSWSIPLLVYTIFVSRFETFIFYIFSMTLRSWLMLGLLALSSSPMISSGAEMTATTTGTSRAYTETESTYIRSLNCDTFAEVADSMSRHQKRSSLTVNRNISISYQDQAHSMIWYGDETSYPTMRKTKRRTKTKKSYEIWCWDEPSSRGYRYGYNTALSDR
jgi:hypothetical protein